MPNTRLKKAADLPESTSEARSEVNGGCKIMPRLGQDYAAKMQLKCLVNILDSIVFIF